jgi:hypothetical protein
VVFCCIRAIVSCVGTPERWLWVTLPAANQRGMIRAKIVVGGPKGHIVSRVAKNTRTGYDTITCERLNR